MSSSQTPECSLCGNTNYFLRDGYYYCSLCQTQSQSVVEIDFGDGFGALGATYSQSAYRLKQQKEKKEKGDKIGDDDSPLPPFALYEAYAVVFERLGCSLIRLDLPQIVKDALFRLFALYLRRRKVAFEGDADAAEKAPEPFRSKFLRLQKMKPEKNTAVKMELDLDEFYTTAEQSVSTGVAHLYADILGIPSLEEGAEQTEESLEENRKRKAPEMPVVTISSDEESDSGNEEGEDDYEQTAAYSTRLQPTLLIPFCYLACLATAPQLVFVSDLIRWARENLLPVVDAHKLLPERLKHPSIEKHFSNQSRWTHRGNVTSVIYRKALWLASYVGFTPTIRFDVDFVLARFAYDLNLTKHLLPRARLIYRSAKFLIPAFRFDPQEDEILRTRGGPATAPEVAAVALLIAALKLTFGLDDHCEYVISKLADETSERQFSFCRWRLQCKLRSSVAEGESIERVLCRSWIDKRDTWMHALMTELDYSTESDIRSNTFSLKPVAAYKSEETEEKEDEDANSTAKTEVDVDRLRNLFQRHTSIKPNTPLPIENRQLFYPFRETVKRLAVLLEKENVVDLDADNVKLFEQDFFHSEFSFMDCPSAKERIDETIAKLVTAEDNQKRESEFTQLFPCSRAIARTGRILTDRRHFPETLIGNMMQNEEQYEISSAMSWILKTCKSRLEENVFVLFRAVQRIELTLDEEFKKSYPTRHHSLATVP